MAILFQRLRIHRRYVAATVILIVTIAVFLAPRFRASGIQFASTSWRSEHQRRLQDPQLQRYYLFTSDDADHGVLNLASWSGSMQLGSDVKTRFSPGIVPGREEGLTAVLVDDRPYEAMPATFDKALTVEFRMRLHGQGFIRGGNSTYSGTLVAMGDGVWNGFLFSLQFPANMLSFQLGHPKPERPLPVAALSRLAPDVWTHIAGTWDGNEVRIYLNGLLAGRRNCAGPFFQVPKTSRLRIGYVGNGLGSARFDIEHLAMYSRCFSESEILRSAWGDFAGNDEKPIGNLLQAGQRLITGDADEARSQLLASLNDSAQSATSAGLLKFRLGETTREMQSYDEAEQWFAAAEEASSTQTLGDYAALELQSLQLGLHQTSTMRERSDPEGPQGDSIWNQSAAQLEPVHAAYRRAHSSAAVEHWRQKFETSIRPVLESSCLPCHSARKGHPPDLTQLKTDQDAVQAGTQLWHQIARQIPRHVPPIPDAARPTALNQRRLLHWIHARPSSGLCEELAEDKDAPRHLEQDVLRVGFGMTRRLTRNELANAIHDLLGIDVDEDQLPPPEGSGGEGFDNSAATLFTTSMLVERWFAIISDAVDAAIMSDLQTPAGTPRRILTTLPEQTDDYTAAASHCLETLTRRAWRRRINDDELQRLLTLFEQSLGDQGQFSTALGETAKAVLLSPHFLLVSDPEHITEGEYQLLPEEFATRMALFLWGTLPDDELLDAAFNGQLTMPADIRRQIRRMLRDPKSGSLGEHFGLQWLGLQRREAMQPDTERFPDWTAETPLLLQQEAIHFVNYILRENRPLTDLLDADYVIVNDRLAEFYGLSHSGSNAWEVLEVPDHQRGGLLSLGAMLTITSRPERTSPVLRGRWILENILGETVEMPPPDIPPFPESVDADAPLTLRQRLEQHRADPDCAHCHETMDQLGFGLEEFDPTGRVRMHDGTGPVDASAVLPSGEQFEGLTGLRQALNARQEQFLRLLSRRLLGYALGRSLDRFDECVIDRCLERLRDEQNRADALFEEIILSHPFRNRYAQP